MPAPVEQNFLPLGPGAEQTQVSLQTERISIEDHHRPPDLPVFHELTVSWAARTRINTVNRGSFDAYKPVSCLGYAFRVAFVYSPGAVGRLVRSHLSDSANGSKEQRRGLRTSWRPQPNNRDLEPGHSGR